MSTLVASNLQAASGGGTAATLASVNGGPIAGMRNRIINGGMAIDQRNSNASVTFTAGAALGYTTDRWYGYCTGANVTGQLIPGTILSPGTLSYAAAFRITGAAGCTGIGFGQRIESQNSYDLAGTTATLSVSLANTLLTTVTWTAYYANTTDTFGTLASPTRTQIATGTFTVNSTVTRYSTNISVPAAAITGIEIVFTVGAQTSGTWTINNVQLEAGSVATPFERRPYGTELALCQRYYYRISPSAVNTDAGSGTTYNNSGVNIVTVPFPAPMRIAPTALEQSGTASHYSVITSVTTTCTNVPSFNTASPYASSVIFTTGATGTSLGCLGRFASTSGYLAWSAEL